ncbi:MAG: DUF4442 domain-containing protein [Bacteroidales bacterium]|nr:DUF4442 domain-containing protein [Bacteroidales bacterium]
MDLRKSLLNKFKIKLFFLQRMPMGFLAGMRVLKFTDHDCEVSVPYNTITKNPFKSVYFAVQAMAAELSTGVVAMEAVMKSSEKVSMLVFDMDAKFTKKARSKIVFTCNQVEEINNAVKETVETGEGVTINVKSIGIDIDGDVVSEFNFTWTFKRK